MSSPVGAVNGSSSNGQSNAASMQAAIDPLAQEDTFMTLLVTQLQNQDPENPSDPTQLVTELAQFSQLEQMVQINSSVSAIQNVVAPAASSSTPQSGNTGG